MRRVRSVVGPSRVGGVGAAGRAGLSVFWIFRMVRRVRLRCWGVRRVRMWSASTPSQPWVSAMGWSGPDWRQMRRVLIVICWRMSVSQPGIGCQDGLAGGVVSSLPEDQPVPGGPLGG